MQMIIEIKIDCKILANYIWQFGGGTNISAE